MIFRKERLILVLFISFLTFPLTDISAKDIKDKNASDDNIFKNQELLTSIFEKLYNLEKNKKGKINIVHIGDSHIQADFFTNTIREVMQNQFGNGGVGFTFPYSLIRTNGPRYIRYACNATWESLMNVSPVRDVGVGLSGIALYTSAQDFILQLSATDGFEFNTVKIIYPTEEAQYKMSVNAPILESSVSGRGTAATGIKYHKIKSGESLSSIARKYKVTVAQIKKANNMKSNTIHPNKSLKIPVKTATVKPVVQPTNITVNDSTDIVDIISKPYYSSYTSDTTLNRITILPKEKAAMYNLNGFVVENNKPGVIYHSIGVNGAKMTDYNKYPLFFKQLPILEPDLIVLSFGTNESFGKISDTEYIYQLREFSKNIKTLNPNATILVMTPPPSMFRRRRPNTFIVDYTTALMTLNDMPVWDLFTRMGGAAGIGPRGEYARMIARDKVHYTVSGYQAQGSLFVSDFLKAYNYFKKQKN
ncbi:MAG: LysM peptidoglycan-binding domain-containing protein [Dysgonomonas sp.]|nr:LysM peptidoglycan-binding domain-containing protein [Dysgonomonas sp.]